MQDAMQQIWTSVLRPLLSRPNRLQVAALCHRAGPESPEVLLVTSRDTGRWLLPKGWPMKGKTCGEAALQEAWEEAGVKSGTVSEDPIGGYSYEKRLDNGAVEPLDALVYLIENAELSDSYPESHQRKRRWVSAHQAATMVREPELQQLLLRL